VNYRFIRFIANTGLQIHHNYFRPICSWPLKVPKEMIGR